MNQKKIVCCLFVFVLWVTMVMVTGEIKAQDSSVKQTIERLRFIHVRLTDIEQKEEDVRYWLIDYNSGYPDLVKVLLKAVECPKGGCNVRGPFLPLDVIEGNCRRIRGNPNEVIMNHTKEEVIKAYIKAWYGKNSYEKRDLTLEQILRGD